MSETDTNGELDLFDTKNERMIAGAVGGYLIGGGLGAIAGAYIGSEWDG